MINYKVKSRLVRILVLIVAFGFYSMAHAQRVNHPVELRLNESQTKLEATDRGKCSSNNHPGCIEVAPNTQARFNFSLVGNRSCSLPGGSSWILGEVYLGGKGSASEPNRWGGFQNDAEVQADFNFSNASAGQLVKEAGSNPGSIVIFDDNVSPNGYDIWYKVTAECVDSNGDVVGTVDMDPRVKNGGIRET